MYGFSYSAQNVGLKTKIVTVEVDFKKGGPRMFNIVGLPDKATEESRERVVLALQNSRLPYPGNPSGKLTVSLSPADLKKSGPLFDVAIAVGFLSSLGEIKVNLERSLFLGELSLSGDVLKVKGVLPLVQGAKEKGFKEVFVPKGNAKEAAIVSGIKVFPVENLRGLYNHLLGKSEILPQRPSKISFRQEAEVLLDDIVEQDFAKRALQIAAAGGHNLSMYGPPGTGKTMLAKAFTSLLPRLSEQEVLEVTAIHSVAGKTDKPIVAPPLRAPHHSASYAAVSGGGADASPGEISLAHRGVLFLDEFPEFDRRVINSLRQPLEDGKITISRAGVSVSYPSKFILLVAMNPCPCGYYGSDKCICTPFQVGRYWSKISGPIMDRIDLWVEVLPVSYGKLMEKGAQADTQHKKAKENILNARALQAQRYKSPSRLNAGLSSRGIKYHIKLTDAQKNLLNNAAEKLNLSPRAYHRILKVARTIADLDQKRDITDEHILEALSFRPKDLLDF